MNCLNRIASRRAGLLLACWCCTVAVAAPPAAGVPDYSGPVALLRSEKIKDREQAREQLEKAAASDPKAAALILGQAWLGGAFGEQPDLDQATPWLEKAAEAGEKRAWLLLANQYSAKADDASQQRATGYLRKAAEAGEAAAWIELGGRLLAGRGCTANQQEAQTWLAKAVEAGHGEAWAVSAAHLVEQGNEAQARQHLQNGIEMKSTQCMFDMAVLLSSPEGSEADKDQAMKLLEQAADGGHVRAALEMVRQESAQKEPRKLKVYEWLQRAALQGDALAQESLGILYHDGRLTGVPDRAAAANWLSPAAQAGLPVAQYLLAAQLESGDGVPSNPAAAYANYEGAMAQGHAGATLACARFIGTGGYAEGVAADLPRAWATARLAKDRAAAGDQQEVATAASALIGEITTRMSGDQFAEAGKAYEALAGKEQARLAELAKRQQQAKAAAEAAEKAAAEKRKQALSPLESLPLPEGAVEISPHLLVPK